jgi:chromatin remodeling complex protein RSC6
MAAKKKATPKKKPAAKKPAAPKKKPSARKPNAAFMKPVQPDAVLAEVVGNKPMPRTELTKKLWAYIKKHGLQDKTNRRMINADDALKEVFGGKKQVSMFDMTKLVGKHVK